MSSLIFSSASRLAASSPSPSLLALLPSRRRAAIRRLSSLAALGGSGSRAEFERQAWEIAKGSPSLMVGFGDGRR